MSTGGRVALWDFDGTLGERTGMWSGAVKEALDDCAPEHRLTKSIIAAELSSGFPWHSPQVAHPHLGSPDAWWTNVKDVVGQALLRCGLTAETTGQAVERLRARYLDPAAWRLFEDTLPTLDRLIDLGWRNAILSNHVPELPTILAALGLADRFVAIINSAEIGFEKPHPQAFRIALLALGEPRETWMIGDNPVADVEGAVRAGMRAILVRSANPNGHRSITDLAEVIDILQGIGSDEYLRTYTHCRRPITQPDVTGVTDESWTSRS